jgi:hypothetical protein
MLDLATVADDVRSVPDQAWPDSFPSLSDGPAPPGCSSTGWSGPSPAARSAIMITRSRRLGLKLVYQATHNLPGDTQDDDLPLEVPSFEQIFDRYEPSHLSIIACQLAFAPEPFRLSFQS